MNPPLSAPAALLRRRAPELFLCTLFAPPTRREALFVLYAFDTELARARAVASEPGLALIRLHWWREVVEGARRRHEVAGPLGEALDAGQLAPAELLEMIDGRELETESLLETRADWVAYHAATGGARIVAAGLALGATPAASAGLRRLGTGIGMAAQLRAAPVLARSGHCLLPADTLAVHGLAAPDAGRMLPALRDLAEEARALLAPVALPRSLRPAALPAVLARRDLRHIGRPPMPRGLGDRLAVSWAGLTGR